MSRVPRRARDSRETGTICRGKPCRCSSQSKTRVGESLFSNSRRESSDRANQPAGSDRTTVNSTGTIRGRPRTVTKSTGVYITTRTVRFLGTATARDDITSLECAHRGTSAFDDDCQPEFPSNIVSRRLKASLRRSTAKVVLSPVTGCRSKN